MIFMDWFQQEFKDEPSVAEQLSSNKLALLEVMLKIISGYFLILWLLYASGPIL